MDADLTTSGSRPQPGALPAGSAAVTGVGGTVVLALLMIVLGVLLGLVGAFLVPRGPRPGGTLLSVGVGVAVLGNLAAPVLGRVALGRVGGAVPLGGWLAAVFAMSQAPSNGSVVLPGGGDLAPSVLVFLFGGSLAGVLAAFVPARHRSHRAARHRHAR